MSKLKSKGGNTPEVHSARSKLDGVLQTLVTKKEDSPSDDAQQEEDPLEDSLQMTPTKRPGVGRIISRKRKRGKEEVSSPEMGQYHHTFVMKLFERSVDLAQFEEDTALYPVCRAWMRNQPHNRDLGPSNRSPTPEPDIPYAYDEEDLQDVYRLPPAIPCIKSEDGMDRDLRVPIPVPQPDETLDIHADPESAPAPEEILLNHMARWKQVRSKWRQAAHQNEARHLHSISILKAMYEKQCSKDQG